jgi:DNA replication protein DnaC
MMTPISQTFTPAPTRPQRDDPDAQDAREALSRVASHLGEGEDADDLTWAWRRAGRVPCPHCRGMGLVMVAGTQPGRRRVSGYCACANGEKQRENDRKDREREIEAQLAIYSATWTRLLNAPPHIYAQTLADFPEESVRNAAKTFLRRWGWKRNLILYGLTGRGKTSLVLTMAKALRKEALAGEPKYVRFFSMGDMQRYLQAGLESNQTGHGASYDRRMDALGTCALLICDDVGTERRTEWWPDAWFRILYARYNAGLPTWITTNLAVEVKKHDDELIISGPFVEWLDDHGRLLSRLLENGITKEVTGRDLRLARRPAGGGPLA